MLYSEKVRIYTNKLFKSSLVETQVKLAAKFRLLPFHWDSQVNAISVTQSPSRLKIWKIITTIYCLFAFCEIINFGHQIHKRGKDMLPFILLRTFFVSTHFGGAILSFSGYENAHNFPFLFACLKAFQVPKLDYFLKIRQRHKYFSIETFVHSLILGVEIFAVFLLPLATFIFPYQMTSVIMISSVLPSACVKLTLLFKIICYVIESFLSLPSVLIGGLMATHLVDTIANLNRHLCAIQ